VTCELRPRGLVMGVSKCSQYCDTGISEKIGCADGSKGNPQFAWVTPSSVLPPAGGGGSGVHRTDDSRENASGDQGGASLWPPWQGSRGGGPHQEMSALSYTPPPPPEYGKDVEALLGTPLPARPRASVSSSAPPAPWRSPPYRSEPSTRTPPRSQAVSWARPGEPVNKVYVQFSNDLEGFLPYTLVISEAQGLEFTSLCASPDFTLDPLNIIKVSRVDFDVLMRDAFFVSLSKSIHQRIVGSDEFPLADSKWPPHLLEEKLRPPYRSIVQLSVRRTIHEGGQVLVFIAVQSEPLAEELVGSCHKLKKRRAVRATYDDSAAARCDGVSSRSVSRGCPTPRTAASGKDPSKAPAPAAATTHTPPRTPASSSALRPS